MIIYIINLIIFLTLIVIGSVGMARMLLRTDGEMPPLKTQALFGILGLVVVLYTNYFRNYVDYGEKSKNHIITHKTQQVNKTTKGAIRTMKALIIEPKDIKTLHKRLELEKFKIQERGLDQVEQIHRQFNYIIRTWFEEQGL